MHDILRERAHNLSRGSNRISERSEWEEAIQNVKKLETIQALKLLDVNSEDINNINKCSNLTKLFLKPDVDNPTLHMKLRLPSSIKVLSIAGWKYDKHATVTVQPWKHLEVLKLKHVNVEGSLNNIRKDKLAFVELVALKHDHSSVFSLGNNPYLRHLRLSCADFEKFPGNSVDICTLESLKLDRCERLRELERVVDLQSLQGLDLSGCTMLQRLPETFGSLKCLRNLLVKGCKRLETLPESFGELSSLVELEMDGCSGLVSICDSLCKLSRLEVLALNDCTNLRRLPESFGRLHCLERLEMRKCERLETLPESFGELSSLVELEMDGCSGLVSLCESFTKLVRLEVLTLRGCTNLSRLPVSFGELSSLVDLNMDGCTSLKNLCESFCKLVRLEELDFNGCKKFQRLPESFGDLQCLKKLVMSGCNGLEFLPESFLKLSSLQFLEMDGCCSLVSLCDNFGRLSRLQELGLSGCKKLERLPESFGDLLSLEYLNMTSCEGLKCLPTSFGQLSSLKVLILISCEGLKCLPKSFGQLSSLIVLCMQGCIGLKGSLDILGNLSSLIYLTLSGCSGLEKLPEDLEEFLPCLLLMDIRGCDELIRNTDLSKLVSMRSLLIILHSTTSHASLLRLAIHVTEEVLEAQDHIIEHHVVTVLRQCRSEMETLLKGKGGGRYVRMEEGGEMVWEDAVSSDVVRNGAKVLYVSPGCEYLLEYGKIRLQEAVEEGYEVVLVDDGMCRWNRHVGVEGKKLKGEMPWNEEDKQMMEEMLSQLPHGRARVWTSLYPKNCLLLTLLFRYYPLPFVCMQRGFLVSEGIWERDDDECITWNPRFCDIRIRVGGEPKTGIPLSLLMQLCNADGPDALFKEHQLLEEFLRLAG